MRKVRFKGLSTTPSEGELPEGVMVGVKGNMLNIFVPVDADFAEYVVEVQCRINIFSLGSGMKVRIGECEDEAYVNIEKAQLPNRWSRLDDYLNSLSWHFYWSLIATIMAAHFFIWH